MGCVDVGCLSANGLHSRYVLTLMQEKTEKVERRKKSYAHYLTKLKKYAILTEMG